MGLTHAHGRVEMGNPRNPLIRANPRFRHGGAVGGSYLLPLTFYLGIGLAVGRSRWENHLTARAGLRII